MDMVDTDMDMADMDTVTDTDMVIGLVVIKE